MSAEYRVHLQIRQSGTGEYPATSDPLPGFVLQGRTVAKATDVARSVARKPIESYREHGDPLPRGLRPLTTQVIELDVPVGVREAIWKRE